MAETQEHLTKVVLQLVEQLKGDDITKHLKAVEKQTVRAERVIKRYQNTLKRAGATTKQAARFAEQYRQQQQRITKSIRATHGPLREQINLLRKQRRESQLSQRATQALSRSLSSLATIIGVGSLSYAALRRAQQTIGQRFNLALTGGMNQITTIKALTGGQNVGAAVDLAARFQAQSPFARFALGDDALKGLISAQKALEPVGLDRANALLLEVTKGLEPDRLRGFLQTAETGDIERALLKAATGGNVEAVTSALNALQLSQEPEKADPLLQAAMEFAQAGNRIADAVDNLIDQFAKSLQPAIKKLTDVIEGLAGIVGGMSPGQLVGTLLGGYVGLKAAGYGARKGLGWILRRSFGLGRGPLPTPAPGVPGSPTNPLRVYPTRVTPGAPRLPGPMRPMLPGPGPIVPAGGATGGAGAAGAAGVGMGTLAAGAAAVGLIAGYGIDWAIHGESFHSEMMKRSKQVTEAKQRQDEMNAKLEAIAAKNMQSEDEITRLRGRRQQMQGDIRKYAEEHQRSGFAQFWGYDQISPEDKKVIEQMQLRANDLTQQIDRLKSAQAELRREQERLNAEAADVPTETTAETLTEDAQRAQKELDDLRKRLEKLQQQAAKRQELQLTATEQGSLSQLARLQYELAKISPYGMVGALPELRELQATIEREISSLLEVLKNIDQGTQEGRVEANRVREQVLRLRLEQKQNAVALRQAVLDSVVQQVFGAGRFSKIIIDQNQNLGIALAKGMVKEFRPITGSTTTSGHLPVSPLSVYQHLAPRKNQNKDDKVSQLREVNKGIKRLIELELQGEDEQEEYQPPKRTANIVAP